jgi:ABC-type dipeptide/oligopeptide/nickel transport system permease component
VALLGVELPALVSGSVLVENVFAWPGMGRVIVSAILAQDPALVSGCFLVYGAAVVVGSLAADLLSAWIDPRVRLSR